MENNNVLENDIANSDKEENLENNYLQNLEKRINEKQVMLEDARKKSSNGMFGGIVCFVIAGVICYFLFIHRSFVIWNILFWIVAFAAFICLMAGISCFFDGRRTGIDEIELEGLKEEYELEQIPDQNRMIRADKQFKLHQKELKRYYDMNLNQTKFLSGLGVFLIIFGLVIIFMSIMLYIFVESDLYVLLIGSISGILTDFVGTLFISMYTQNLKAAIEFHSKLANSNNFLLANSIANKIEDNELRENTLSDIAKGISE